MSEKNWFDDTNDFDTAIRNVEAIATGTTEVNSYRLDFNSRTIYFEGHKMKELFKAYVDAKAEVRGLQDLIKRLNKAAEEAPHE